MCLAKEITVQSGGSTKFFLLATEDNVQIEMCPRRNCSVFQNNKKK